MLRRKITDQLLAWKNTPGRKPLIIKGCRQCGKTFSVLEFARKNYKHTVYLNFFENPDYASVFSGSLEIDNIVMMLSALLGKDAVFEPGQTILILDEIQDCPEARTALKFFRIDGRYDVIGTGSLLGVKGYGKGRDPFLSDRRRFLKCTHWILKNSYGPMTSPNLSLRCCKVSGLRFLCAGSAAQPDAAAFAPIYRCGRNAGRCPDLCDQQADG